MNRGLLRKIWGETWRTTLTFGLGLLAFELILSRALPQFFDERVGPLLRLPFLRNLLGTLLGSDPQGIGSSGTILAFAWVHPLVLSLTWGHVIVQTSRVPAGEVDRGTADIFFTLPVSRTQVFLHESVGWLVSAAFVLACGWLGACIGAYGVGDPENGPTELGPVLANLYALTVAVGCLATLVSGLGERRGRVMGVLFGLLLASFFVNFLGQFWAPARHLAFLGMLHYYQPMPLVQGGEWPAGDIAILLAIASVLWLAAGAVVLRRDLHTG